MPTWCWTEATGPVGGYQVWGSRNGATFVDLVGPNGCVSMGARDAEFTVRAFRWEQGTMVTGPWSEPSAPYVPLPEPGLVTGLLAGLALLAVLARRRRKR